MLRAVNNYDMHCVYLGEGYILDTYSDHTVTTKIMILYSLILKLSTSWSQCGHTIGVEDE